MNAGVTMGEILAGRELKSELRAGVPHYVPGQHHAEIAARGVDMITGIGEEIVRLSYVDTMGHVVVVLCSRFEGDDRWHPTWIGAAGHHHQTAARLAPRHFRLSERMLEAIAAADERGTLAEQEARAELAEASREEPQT